MWVVGIGQGAAGDDGVGLEVLEALSRGALPSGAALMRLKDPMDLVPLLESGQQVVLVDAVLGEPTGQVLELEAGQLADDALQPASSHGFGAGRALALARVLAPHSPPVRVVAVTIARPGQYRAGLSAAVAAAVPEAAERVLSLVGLCVAQRTKK